jgi:hypothetical protein
MMLEAGDLALNPLLEQPFGACSEGRATVLAADHCKVCFQMSPSPTHETGQACYNWLKVSPMPLRLARRAGCPAHPPFAV